MGSKTLDVGVNVSSFLFVNQDPSSTGPCAKDSELNRSKQRHVQRLHFVRKKRGLRGSKDSKAPNASDGVQSHVARCDAASLLHDTPKQSMSGLSSMPAFIHCRNNSRVSNRECKSNEPDKPGRVENSLSPSIQISENSSPAIRCSNDGGYGQETGGLELGFSFIQTKWNPEYCPETLGMDIDAWCINLMQYYKSVTVPSIFRADTRVSNAAKANRHMKAVEDELLVCRSDPAHLFAFLAAQTARMQLAEGRLLLPGISEKEVQHGPGILKTKSIQELRSRLTNGYVDQQMIYDVYRLYTSEVMVGDFAAAAVHFRALDYMIKEVGGLHSLDQFLVEKIITGDIFAAARRLSTPRLELTWDPGELPVELQSLIKPQGGPLLELGQWFIHPQNALLFTPSMQFIFHDLIPESLLNICSWSHSELSDQHMSYMLLRRTAIEHRLLSMNPTTVSHSSPMEEPVRISLIFWIGLTSADPIRKMTIPPLLPRLRQALENTNMLDFMSRAPDLLLWVLIIGVAAAQGAEADRDWFVECAIKVAGYMNITHRDTFTEYMQRFFYVEEAQGDAVGDLVGCIEHARIRENEGMGFLAG